MSGNKRTLPRGKCRRPGCQNEIIPSQQSYCSHRCWQQHVTDTREGQIALNLHSGGRVGPAALADNPAIASYAPVQAAKAGVKVDDPRHKPYRPYGGALEIMYAKEDEVLIAGPAGTGKSRAVLEKINICCEKYPGCRWMLIRKTRESLTQSAMVTFSTKVLPEGTGVHFHTGEQEYQYPNGSVVVVMGLDKPSKKMSTDFDGLYVQEATELEESDWEMVTTRLRNGVIPYQQALADCNPGPPTHWLRRRIADKKMREILSRHEDNPALYSVTEKRFTPLGTAYIAKLDALTGVRYLRLRLGVWAAAEGMVYDSWDRRKHMVDRFLPSRDWPRYWVVDFGYTNTFVWQDWVEDPDGRLILVKEIYRSRRLVEDHARVIAEVTAGDPRPREVICDHDAEDRATLERHLHISTNAAFKDVQSGIQVVSERLRTQPDGKPRLLFMRDALVERDSDLFESGLPTCTVEEFESYVWQVDRSTGRITKELPVKANDHGMDCVRYLSMARQGPQISTGAKDFTREQMLRAASINMPRSRMWG